MVISYFSHVIVHLNYFEGMSNGYFIGAKSDIGIQHNFVWSEDSSRVYYFDWWRGQPNNAFHRVSHLTLSEWL